MAQPSGFIDRDKPDYVCKLNKALYGLKQAPRTWYMELQSFLIAYGFVNSISDSYLFILNKHGNPLFVLVYVDDIVITDNNSATVECFVQLLSNLFSLKDLNDLTYFLGIEASRTSKGLLLTQIHHGSPCSH